MNLINQKNLFINILGFVICILILLGCHAHHHGHNHAHNENNSESQKGLTENEREAMQMHASKSGVLNAGQKSAWCSEFPKSSVCN